MIHSRETHLHQLEKWHVVVSPSPTQSVVSLGGPRPTAGTTPFLRISSWEMSDEDVDENQHFINGLVGGIPTPLKNDGVSNSWDDDIPNSNGKIIHSCSKPPTSDGLVGHFTGKPHDSNGKIDGFRWRFSLNQSIDLRWLKLVEITSTFFDVAHQIDLMYNYHQDWEFNCHK